MSGYVFAICFALVTVVFMFALLRNRHMREKYATAWVLVALAVLIVAVFPGILDWFADLFGIKTPINLVFFVASLALLLISVQYSVELSRLEEQSRKLSEECAILRSDIDDLRRVIAGRVGPGEPGGAGGPEGPGTPRSPHGPGAPAEPDRG
ncbi:DUF2304 domain-containing protein [Georgenia sp. SYP-B2076]|uniref:DUF2304 domain-containing protein n=1 Tax=Georgenia sp. SYP-B2076 TaxID=2495881 RepID=UPI000F8C4AE9|nr:DUF2304 domain-containing protein [Georgenia sp. SYP-B2076]